MSAYRAGMNIRVTKHAISRYQERIATVSREEAHRRIMAHLPAFKAVLTGALAGVVALGTLEKLFVERER